jgi:hypothetical protein
VIRALYHKPKTQRFFRPITVAAERPRSAGLLLDEFGIEGGIEERAERRRRERSRAGFR